MPHAHDSVNVSDSATAGVRRGGQAHDHLNVSDSASAGRVLVAAGPLVIRLAGTSTGGSHLVGTLTVTPADPVTRKDRRFEVDIKREALVLGCAGTLAGISQIPAPGNPLAGVIGLIVGYAWAEWALAHPPSE